MVHFEWNVEKWEKVKFMIWYQIIYEWNMDLKQKGQIKKLNATHFLYHAFLILWKGKTDSNGKKLRSNKRIYIWIEFHKKKKKKKKPMPLTHVAMYIISW